MNLCGVEFGKGDAGEGILFWKREMTDIFYMLCLLVINSDRRFGESKFRQKMHGRLGKGWMERVSRKGCNTIPAVVVVAILGDRKLPIRMLLIFLRTGILNLGMALGFLEILRRE